MFSYCPGNLDLSLDLMIYAFIVYSTSAAVYQSLRNQNMWILPSITTLKRILRELDCKSELNNEQYLQLRANKLNRIDKNVILIIELVEVILLDLLIKVQWPEQR